MKTWHTLHLSVMTAGVERQIDQAFKNLSTVASAAGSNLSQIVKLNIYLTDLNNIPFVNTAMTKYFSKQTYPL